MRRMAYTESEWEIPATRPPPRAYTESPRPIENVSDDEREGSRPGRSGLGMRSNNKVCYVEESSSISPDPHYRRPHYSPTHDTYRFRETSSYSYPHSRTADSDWYSRPRADSFSSDDFDPYDKFDFSSQTQSIVIESSKGDDSDAETPESEERVTLAKDGKGGKTSSQLAFVDSSVYTGNAEMGSSHTATLNMVHDLNMQKQPLFRWLWVSLNLGVVLMLTSARHVPQDVMNFEDFWVN